MSREKLLPAYPDGFRLPLRDSEGMAKWLASALKAESVEGRKARSPLGRPRKFDLVRSAKVTGVSRSTLSKLLAPAIRPTDRGQREVTVGVLRRLAVLPGGEGCLDFVFTARDRDRAERLFAELSLPLSEPEASLLLEWLSSPQQGAIRGFARRLSVRGFDNGEIMEWIRWVLRPFVTAGLNSVVMRSWSEMTQRERGSFLAGSLGLAERLLARREPAKMRILQASERIDWEDTLVQIALGLGIPHVSSM